MRTLTTDDFNRTCPSFYATAPKGDVSEKYGFINSREIAVMLWDLGWKPVWATESRAVSPENKGYTKHMVRFVHKDMDLGDERIELLGVNSHNRSAAYKFLASVRRKICDNGLHANTSSFGDFRIRHTGDVESRVVEAVKGITSSASQVAGHIDRLKDIELTPNEQGVFASEVHSYIWPMGGPVSVKDILKPRRGFDSEGGDYYKFGSDLPKKDLWTTYNVVQENLMKGGLKGRATTGRKTTTRAIKSIDRDVKLNQALWSLTEHMADLKQGAA